MGIGKKTIVIAVFILLIATLTVAANTVFITNKPSSVYFMLGKFHYMQEDYTKAVDYFQKSLDQKQTPETMHNLALAHYHEGDVKESRRLLQQTVRVDPHYAKAYYSLGLIQFAEKDYDNAIRSFSKLTKEEPSNPHAHFDLAVAHVERFKVKENKGTLTFEDLADIRQGIHHYDKAHELDPDFPNAQNNRNVLKEVLRVYTESAPQ